MSPAITQGSPGKTPLQLQQEPASKGASTSLRVDNLEQTSSQYRRACLLSGQAFGLVSGARLQVARPSCPLQDSRNHDWRSAPHRCCSFQSLCSCENVTLSFGKCRELIVDGPSTTPGAGLAGIGLARRQIVDIMFPDSVSVGHKQIVQAQNVNTHALHVDSLVEGSPTSVGKGCSRLLKFVAT